MHRRHRIPNADRQPSTDVRPNHTATPSPSLRLSTRTSGLAVALALAVMSCAPQNLPDAQSADDTTPTATADAGHADTSQADTSHADTGHADTGHGDPATLVDAAFASNQLGFLIHTTLLAEHGNANLVTSPLSTASALALLSAATDGETAEQLRAALGHDPRDQEAFAALVRSLRATTSVELNLATALWVTDNIATDEPALADLARRYDIEAAVLPLGETSIIETIDTWVSDQTAGMIPRLAESLDLPDPHTALVVANALAFVGDWTTPFPVDATRPAPFNLDVEAAPIEVMTMHRPAAPIPYLDDGDVEVVRLAYGDDQRFGMEILLPAPGISLDELLAQLDAARWRALTDDLMTTDVEVALPRFTLTGAADLTEALASLGVQRVFTPQAQFDPITTAPAQLRGLTQTTFVEVSETGTRAAAVTGGQVGDDDDVSIPIDFRVDRPFAFTISDQSTGAVLLLGTVRDPRG